jgi:hypothetical protein
MSTAKYVTIYCDDEGCASFIDTPEHVGLTARRWAKIAEDGYGWRLGAAGGRDFCPAHVTPRPVEMVGVG